MSENGTTVRQQLRETRQRLRLLHDQALLREAQQVEKRAKLRESLSIDWVTPWLDLARGFNDGWLPIGATGRQGRRYGKDFPIFLTEQQAALIRFPARILCATNNYAIGLWEGVCGYVVGTGLTYEVSIDGDPQEEQYPGLRDALQKILDQYLLRNGFGGNDSGMIRLDAEDYATSEHRSLEEEAFKRTSRDGEFINVSNYNADGTTDERIVEPDQLTQPPGTDFREWGFGRHADPDDAQNVDMSNVQWGDSADDREEIGNDRMTYIPVNTDRTIKRGLTDFYGDTIDTLQLASTLRGNLGETAAQQAAIVGVRQYPAGSPQEISAYNDSLAEESVTDPVTGNLRNIELKRRGQYEDMPEGMEYKPGPIAQSTPIHVQVLQALLRGAAVRWSATEWLASGDSSSNSFANAMAANNQFVIAVKRRQKAIRAGLGLMAVRALNHAVKVANGVQVEDKTYPPELIKKLASVLVSAPSPEATDELAQAQRFEIECRSKVLSVQTWQKKVGLNPDEEQANIDRFTELNQDMGTPLGMPGMQMPNDRGLAKPGGE